MSTMARADLAASLKLLWGDAASYWSLAADADYVRHLDDALPGFGNAWPHRVGASATVTAGVADYPAGGFRRPAVAGMGPRPAGQSAAVEHGLAGPRAHGAGAVHGRGRLGAAPDAGAHGG